MHATLPAADRNAETRRRYAAARREHAANQVAHVVIVSSSAGWTPCEFCALDMERPMPLALAPEQFPSADCECRPCCYAVLHAVEDPGRAAAERAAEAAEAARRKEHAALGARVRRTLADIERAGRQRCVILSPPERDECPACRRLTNRPLTLAEAFVLPPENCSCQPWCRCTVSDDPWLTA